MKQKLFDLRGQWEEAILELVQQTIHTEPVDNSSLADMCNYHMQTGGKRLRAIVPLAIAETLDTDPAALVPFAAACELVHNATLVHDDLQDGDDRRRGEPTVWKKYGDERAINLGDAMLYWPYSLLDRLDCSDDTFRRIVRRFTRQTLRVIDGQDREFLLACDDDKTWDDYLRMVEGKTSGLFMLSSAGAAELAGAAPSLVDAVEQSARHLGVLFQIQDDILDLYGDKGRGQRGMDICEGKVSALAAHFLEQAPDERRDWLRDLLERPRDEVDAADIDRVAEAYRDHGSLDAALEAIERRRRLALDDPVLGEAEALQELLTGIADLFLEPISHVIEAREPRNE